MLKVFLSVRLGSSACPRVPALVFSIYRKCVRFVLRLRRSGRHPANAPGLLGQGVSGSAQQHLTVPQRQEAVCPIAVCCRRQSITFAIDQLSSQFQSSALQSPGRSVSAGIDSSLTVCRAGTQVPQRGAKVTRKPSRRALRLVRYSNSDARPTLTAGAVDPFASEPEEATRSADEQEELGKLGAASSRQTSVKPTGVL